MKQVWKEEKSNKVAAGAKVRGDHDFRDQVVAEWTYHVLDTHQCVCILGVKVKNIKNERQYCIPSSKKSAKEPI